MRGLTDYITPYAWVDTFTRWCVLVDEGYQAIVIQVGRLRPRGPTPMFGDYEVRTIALIADTFFMATTRCVCVLFGTLILISFHASSWHPPRTMMAH